MSLVSLGVRTGMVVVISIPVVLAVTALCMYLFDIGLHKVSLGTLVLALGLLVDDAIIAVEMMAVKLEQGWSRTRAAAFAYTSTAFPMLTGTLVTVAGFLPIALAKSSTGEYTRSIFEVSAIALIVSWFAAVVLVPLLGYHMLPERKRQEHEAGTITNTISTTPASTSVCAAGSRGVSSGASSCLASLPCCSSSRWRPSRCVPQQFFPSSDRPELLVDLRLPEGASFEATLREAKRLEKVLDGQARDRSLRGLCGHRRAAFLPAARPAIPQPNFAQFVITAKSVERSRRS